MSRPIYEPSLPRADAELGYGSRQLFRRPAPVSAVAPPVGADLPWGQRSANIAQVIPSGVTTQILFPTSNVSSPLPGDITAAADGFVLGRDGFWIISCVVNWQTAASGAAYISVNNSTSVNIASQSETTYLNSNKRHVMIWAHPVYVAGGVVKAYFRQNSGGDRDIYGRNLAAMYVRDYAGIPNGVF